MRKIQDFATIGDGIDIKLSGIPNAGMGLWTTRAFKKGHLITEYDGEIISYEKALEMRSQNRDSHVRALNSFHLCIDGIQHPYPGHGGASFANDARNSQKHNAMFATRFDTQLARDRVFLKAKVDVPAGAEVFVCYGNTYWNIRDMPRLVLCSPESQQQVPALPPASPPAAAAAEQHPPASEYDFPSDRDTDSPKDADSDGMQDMELETGTLSNCPSTPATASGRGAPARTTPSSRCQESPADMAVTDTPSGRKQLFGTPQRPTAGSRKHQRDPMQSSHDEAALQKQQQQQRHAEQPGAAAAGAHGGKAALRALSVKAALMKIATGRKPSTAPGSPAQAGTGLQQYPDKPLPPMMAAGLRAAGTGCQPSPAQASAELQQGKRAGAQPLKAAAGGGATGAGCRPSSARLARSPAHVDPACSNGPPPASSPERQTGLDALRHLSAGHPVGEAVAKTHSRALTPADAAAAAAAAAAGSVSLQHWLSSAGLGALAASAAPASTPRGRSAHAASKSPAKGSSRSPKPQLGRSSPRVLQHEHQQQQQRQQQQQQVLSTAPSPSRQQVQRSQPALSPSRRKLSGQRSPAAGGSSRKQPQQTRSTAAFADLLQLSTDLLQAAEDDDDRDGDWSPSSQCKKKLLLQQQQSPGWEVHRAQRRRRAPDPLLQYDGARQAVKPIEKWW